MDEPESSPQAGDLRQLVRQTGLAPALGVGCVVMLVAFAAPVAAVWWFAGFGWGLLGGVAAGLVFAGAVAFFGARMLARRTIERLARGGPVVDGETLPADPDEFASDLIRAATLRDAHLPDLFSRLKTEDPGVNSSVAAIVGERALDDFVNGLESDAERVEQLARIAKAADLGARKLGRGAAGEPWVHLAAELGAILHELVAAMDPEANERVLAQALAEVEAEEAAQHARPDDPRDPPDDRG